MAREHPLEYALKVANGEAVIRHGNALFLRCAKTGEHVAARDDATAALNENGIGGQIFGEIFADGNLDDEVFAGLLTEPAWNFHAPDVVLLRMVTACLANQYAVAVLEAGECAAPSASSSRSLFE